MFSIEVTTGLSIGAGILTYHLIPKFSDMFIKANLFGIDLNKSSGIKVPEATGVVTGRYLATYVQKTWHLVSRRLSFFFEPV